MNLALSVKFNCKYSLGSYDETSPISKLEFQLGAIDEEELNQLSHSSGQNSAWTTARNIPKENEDDNVAPSNRHDMSNTNSVPLRFTPKKTELENLPGNNRDYANASTASEGNFVVFSESELLRYFIGV